MIQKLRQKFTLLVLLVLLLAFGGTVFAINYANWNRLERESHTSLQTLLAGDGQRPTFQTQGGQTHNLLAPPPSEETDDAAKGDVSQEEDADDEAANAEVESNAPKEETPDEKVAASAKNDAEANNDDAVESDSDVENYAIERQSGSETDESDSNTDDGSGVESDAEDASENDAEDDEGGASEAGVSLNTVSPAPPAGNSQSVVENGSAASGEQTKPFVAPNGTAVAGDTADQTLQNGKIQHPQQMLSQANLSNFYTVRLDKSGSVLSWFSDRPELYSDQQIAESVAQVLELGADSGRVDNQFFMMGKRPYGTLLVVLDGQMEIESARQLLTISSLVGLAAYLLMSAGAVVLIRRMTKPVQESFDKQKQFVWDASHELKTPLAVISANSEVLAGEIGENRWLGYIQSEVQRTDQLVKNLLTLARMDRTGHQIEKHPFDLSRALLSVTLPFESMAFESGKTLITDITPEIRYSGDEEMLKQMTVILLDNAMKYANDGGTVTISLLAKGEKKVLRVHNTGAGIEQKDLSHIFERFYRADEAHSREKEGNGLGLAIAKTIVAAHKGKITAESEPGRWACFTVTL